jgi:hypothetical protein
MTIFVDNIRDFYGDTSEVVSLALIFSTQQLHQLQLPGVSEAGVEKGASVASEVIHDLCRNLRNIYALWREILPQNIVQSYEKRSRDEITGIIFAIHEVSHVLQSFMKVELSSFSFHS